MKYFKKLFRFCQLWPELISLPLAFVLWAFSDNFIRFIDPTAAVYDGGIFQVILYGFIGFIIGNGIAFLWLRLNFPTLYDHYSSKEFKSDFKNLKPWERLRMVFWVYALFLLAFALMVRVI